MQAGEATEVGVARAELGILLDGVRRQLIWMAPDFDETDEATVLLFEEGEAGE